MLTGKARTIYYQILDAFWDAGYIPECFLVDSSKCSVPQKRERAIFVAQRKDIRKHGIVFDFHDSEITFGEIRTEHGICKPAEGTLVRTLFEQRTPEDKRLSNVKTRLGMSETLYSVAILRDDEVAPTVMASNGGRSLRDCDGEWASMEDYRRMQTFPEDYDFCGSNQAETKYILGMSVPPRMMEHISRAVYDQILA